MHAVLVLIVVTVAMKRRKRGSLTIEREEVKLNELDPEKEMTPEKSPESKTNNVPFTIGPMDPKTSGESGSGMGKVTEE